MAGEDNSAEGAALMNEVRRSPVPGLRVLGNLDQQGVLALLGESLVSVVPSVWYENTPNAILESLATGTPVVASRLGSMRDMIAGTGAGELFVPGDPADLARVLDRLLSDRPSLEQMGARAQRLARERYSPDVHAQALVGLFEDVVSAHRVSVNGAGAPRDRIGKGDGRPAHGGGLVSSLAGLATAAQRLRALGGDGADGVVDAAVIVTYRCNAKCQMCQTWQFPTKPSEEFAPDLLRKLPDRLGRVNITGGEPMLRKDIDEIVEILAPKARRLEISTNGYFTDRLVEIGRRHPEMTIRISLEGMPVTNDRVRGTKDGFAHALRSYHALRDVGVRDLGFAVTIQDANAHDLLALYGMVEDLGAEFAQAVPHNSYYFHTDQNRIDDIDRVQTAIRDLMEAFLRSRRPKEWFRAYLNRGLVDYVGGAERRLACTGGTDIFFLDPHGEVYPCNGWDISMGNLHERTFEEIWTGERAEEVRSAVCTCDRRCWMTGTAVPAMRHNLPRVAWWVARNKARLALDLPVDLRD